MKNLIIVTGGAGFIGSHLVNLLLSQEWDVTIIDDFSTGEREKINPKARLLEASVTDLELIKPALQEAEYVFHLAALPRIQPSFDDPMIHEQVNVIGTIRCLEALKGSTRLRKFIYSCSSACYGNPTELPTSESAPIECLSPYALQKYTAEQYALILGNRFGIPVTSLRYFNAYGPGSFNPKNPFNAYSSVIGVFHDRNQAGLPLDITGDGMQSRDFVHVFDIADANLKAAISAPNNSIYNVGSGERISINDLAALFGGSVNYLPERQGEAHTTWADISKIMGELGWKPRISLSEGIASMAQGS